MPNDVIHTGSGDREPNDLDDVSLSDVETGYAWIIDEKVRHARRTQATDEALVRDSMMERWRRRVVCEVKRSRLERRG